MRDPVGVEALGDICITGGGPLGGTISVQSSKNAALPMMAASCLHKGTSVLRDCPRIADVDSMIRILRRMGADIRWEGKDLYLDCSMLENMVIPGTYTERMRSSVILLSVMLARKGWGSLGYPGGCVIGKRPIDMHLAALGKLGAQIRESPEVIEAECGRLKGTGICFPKRSVGATQQGILAAVLAEGETVLENCAREPEICWLCRYLQSMGARIAGEGSDCIRIQGVSQLEAGDFRVPPDRIVAGTYICAAAISRGSITLERFPDGELDAFLQVYRKMGGQYEGKSGKLLVNGNGVRFSPGRIVTETFPGFPTDLQAPLMAVLTTVDGVSEIKEQIFENRFQVVRQMNKMGADIRVEDHTAVIHGGRPLRGCRVQAQELRGGAALILMALAAEGETWLEGDFFIQRGYEHICEDLSSVGGMIKKTQEYEYKI